MSSEVDRLKCHLFLPYDTSVNEEEYDKGMTEHYEKQSKGLADLCDCQLSFIIKIILVIIFMIFPVS